MRKITSTTVLVIAVTSQLFSINPPDWAKDVTWYQIFPERFYNGDHANDPKKESLMGTWPWEKQGQWDITPWTSDWYQMQPWEVANGQPFNYQFQARRYGGDIQGIIDKLDYLQDLGITALYLNPVFDSPSSHKYGAAYYHHIDRYFGPDPLGDAKLIAEENPEDPNTWQWTAADKLFLKLIEEVHVRKMRIIIDGVFNHSGLTFWAFQDVLKNREKSPYYSWYSIEGSGLSDASHINEYRELPDFFVGKDQTSFKYSCFVEDLPAFRQDEYGPVEPIRNHLKLITQRWMDPNKDGDPSDGIDGWRLDVAERVQIKFWDLFGSWVREINPDAYITGEVWWEDYWTNKQFNAAPWLTNGRFDAVMNYRFTDAMYRFFIDDNTAITVDELDKQLQSVVQDYGEEAAFALQNLLGSHDMERLASAIINPDRWVDHGNNLHWNKEFDIRKPTLQERETQKAILAFQFAYIGAPYIYYGDEAGMWGADDPDCRKPMLWPEFNYDSETTHPCDTDKDCNYSRPHDTVEFDANLFQYYKSLISLRNNHDSLRRGSYKTVDTKNNVFAFKREYQDEVVLAIFNPSKNEIKIPKHLFEETTYPWKIIFSSTTSKDMIILPPKSGKLFKRTVS